MEGSSKKKNMEFIPEEREWLVQKGDHKLELTLAPPGQQNWPKTSKLNKESEEINHPLFNLGFHNKNGNQSHDFSSLEIKRSQVESVFPSPWSGKASPSSFLQPSSSAMAKESLMADLQNNAEKKAYSSVPAKTAVHNNSSQKRTAPGPVVGWPPIRSFRKNLSSSTTSTKQTTEPNDLNSKNKGVGEKSVIESSKKGFFVKINMDGVPIGRKVDLKAYDSYQKLSNAVDELFRGLLAAQRTSSANIEQEEEKAITGVLDGSGEYTLVYEDNEGDKMLVGDVPWKMFVSTVKRLRVLKSSEVCVLSFGIRKQSKSPS